MAEEIQGGNSGGTEGQEGQLEELVVDGQVHKLTPSELKAEAQKARGVLPKVQAERDKLKQDYQELSERAEIMGRFINDFDAILKGGEEAKTAIQRMSKAIEVQPKELMRMIGEAAGVTETPIAKGKKAAKVQEEEGDDDLFGEEESEIDRSTARKEARRLSLEDLDPELAKDLKFARDQRLGKVRESLHGDLDSAFDAHETIGKILKSENAKKVKVVKNLGRKALQRRVTLENAEVGPRLYREVAQEVATILEDLGIRPDSDDKPRPSLDALGVSGSDYDFSPDELHQEQPPKRIPVSSGNYRRNFAQRLLHKIVQAGGLSSPEE